MKKIASIPALMICLVAMVAGCTAEPEQDRPLPPPKIREEYHSDMTYGEYGAWVINEGAKLETLTLKKMIWKASNGHWIPLFVFDGWDSEADIQYLKKMRVSPDIQMSDRANEQLKKAVNLESWEMLMPAGGGAQ